ncbi:DoxX family protein [Nonlabens sp. YIK11]|uniref:DoxX family protein n=1 Tax=Nonlabens sp. YIK11 TaxID=1453349 RepID=UPI0018CFF78F|nr:DoxX family protein [Nonlabens sp. YIK11]
MFGRIFMDPILSWIGRTIFETNGRLETVSTGSGDDTMSWLSLFLQAVVAITGTVVWTAIDYKRPSYNQLRYWFIVALRIFLIFFMITYGMVKVFKIQFMDPSLLRLLQPVGDMSPMGLAWTYMGHSNAFNVFVGFAEVLGGLLLIPRRTQTLGALIVTGVMTHVAVMNFTYDIPVKIFSVHLVLMALFIFLTDSRRFIDVFFKNKAVKSYEYYNPADGNTWNKIVIYFKWIATGLLLVAFSIGGFIGEHSLGHKRDKPDYYGIWEVQLHVEQGDTLMPLTTATGRWRYLILDNENMASIKMTNDSIESYKFELDSTKTRIKMYPKDSELDGYNITLRSMDSTNMRLQSSRDNDSLIVDLRLKDLKSFRLLNRGFHWVNEYPYNR